MRRASKNAKYYTKIFLENNLQKRIIQPKIFTLIQKYLIKDNILLLYYDVYLQEQK